VAVDAETGTTNRTLWPADAAPRRFETTHGVDEWLTLIASGRAVGISSEATAAQHPRPGIAYRPLEDADPIPVWLTWWKDSPPDRLTTLLDLVREVYAAQVYTARQG